MLALHRKPVLRFSDASTTYAAAAAGHVNMVRLLLSHGASVRDTDDCRANAMYYAVRCGTGELIACLVDAMGTSNDTLPDPTSCAGVCGHGAIQGLPISMSLGAAVFSCSRRLECRRGANRC